MFNKFNVMNVVLKKHSQVWFVLALMLLLTGCEGEEMTPAARLAFDNAGDAPIEVDTTKLTMAIKPSGPYRLVSNDVVEFYMPHVLVTVSQEAGRLPNKTTEDKPGVYDSRINSKGEVAMPLLGWVKIEGLTLLETQEKLTNLYYPAMLELPPTIVASVLNYSTQPVSILGAVSAPGTYELQEREMSLVSLLAKCGGIKEGASVIRVKRSTENNPNAEPVVLPIKGLDMQFTDVELKPGDVVQVEALNEHVISVIGLVNNATTFPQPPYLKVNLLQSLARAGGLNAIADPHWATVYRLAKDGSIVAGHFKIAGGSEIPSGASVVLKPGDVVDVYHTWLTDTRLIAVNIIRIGVGIGATPNLVN